MGFRFVGGRGCDAGQPIVDRRLERQRSRMRFIDGERTFAADQRGAEVAELELAMSVLQRRLNQFGAASSDGLTIGASGGQGRVRSRGVGSGGIGSGGVGLPRIADRAARAILQPRRRGHSRHRLRRRNRVLPRKERQRRVGFELVAQAINRGIHRRGIRESILAVLLERALTDGRDLGMAVHDQLPERHRAVEEHPVHHGGR